MQQIHEKICICMMPMRS